MQSDAASHGGSPLRARVLSALAAGGAPADLAIELCRDVERSMCGGRACIVRLGDDGAVRIWVSTAEMDVPPQLQAMRLAVLEKPAYDGGWAVWPLRTKATLIGAFAWEVAHSGPCACAYDLLESTADAAAVLLSAREGASGRQSRADWMNRRDVLAVLPDRRALTQELAARLERAAVCGTRVAFVLVDLDHFKLVNQVWGYMGGDEALLAVAGQLTGMLRPGDFLARTAGDEFGLLLHDVDDAAHLLERLEGLDAQQPLVVELHGPRNIAISFRMGVAVYPDDGSDAPTLARRADTALRLLQTSRAKHVRRWGRWGDSVVTQLRAGADTDEPFGPHAALLLQELSRQFEELHEGLLDRFIAEFDANPDVSRAFQWLTDEDRRGLRSCAHTSVRLLLSSNLSRETLVGHAGAMGRVCALAGVSTRLLVRGLGQCLNILQQEIGRLEGSSQARRQQQQLLAERLQVQLQAYVDAAHALREVFQDFVTVLEAESQAARNWNAFVQVALKRMVDLPGVRALTLCAPNAHGEFVIEASMGVEAFDEAMLRRYGELRCPTLQTGATQAVHPSVKAWRYERLSTVASYAHEASVEPWRDAARDAGVRSSASIPIRDTAKCTVLVLNVYGAFPGMFDSRVSQAFLIGVGALFSSTWQRLHEHGRATAVPLAERQRCRDLLIDDRVEVHFQPIVDLKTGMPYAVEALARLVLENGRLVMPNEFLQHFGQSELRRLFITVLQRALRALAALDAKGVKLCVSVNLPPQVMMQPKCSLWVREALDLHDIEPGRLQLELLESSEFVDAGQRDVSMRELAALGVEMVMDDLGSGYSSLLRLCTLPFRTVKIDRELVRAIDDGPGRGIDFIGSVVQMAQSLGLRAVVEGLETPELVEVAAVLGADAGQGYFLGRPMPAAALSDWALGFDLLPERCDARSPVVEAARAWRRRRAGVDACAGRRKHRSGSDDGRLQSAQHFDERS